MLEMGLMQRLPKCFNTFQQLAYSGSDSDNRVCRLTRFSMVRDVS